MRRPRGRRGAASPNASLDVPAASDGPPALAGDPDVAVVVVHADAEVVVVDKPAGVVVHPGAGQANGTPAHGLLARFPEVAGVGEPDRPGIVHRLDKGTSGLLVVARTPGAYASLVAQLQARTVERRYHALVRGRVEADAGLVDARVGRGRKDPTRMAVSTAGREARTRYQVVTRFDRPAPVTLVECRLETGSAAWVRRPGYCAHEWRRPPRSRTTAAPVSPRSCRPCWATAPRPPGSPMSRRRPPRWSCWCWTGWGGCSSTGAGPGPGAGRHGGRPDHLRGAHHHGHGSHVPDDRAVPAHGVVGYRVKVGPGAVMNVLRWRVAGADARHDVPPAEFHPHPVFAGTRPPVVTRAEFAATGFSGAHLAATSLQGWRLPSALAVEVRRQVVAGAPFVYAYYDGVDKVAHDKVSATTTTPS